MSTPKNWTLPRHKVIRNILAFFLYPFVVLRYGVKIGKAPDHRQYLVIMNHQTGFDQFFVSLAFRNPVYYLATEDIFSLGWISNVIRYLVAPIPIKKQTMDIQAVKNCIKVAKEGGTIALAPEGNRTFCGRTVHMNSSIASLVKKLRLPLAIFRIEHGYGIQPRWSDVVRRGRMKAYVYKVLEPEEYADMSNEELFEAIREGLWVNEACVDGVYRHKKTAEYQERVLYVCPHCGLSEFESHDDAVTCKHCGLTAKYLETKEFASDDSRFPFRFVADWYDYQNDFVNNLNVLDYCDNPAYTDDVRLSQVIVYKRKELLRKSTKLSLYGDRIVFDDDLVLPFSDVSTITVLGKNKLNVYHDKVVYQIKGSKRFNAMKYMNFYHRHKNMIAGDLNGKFLGI